MTRRTAVRAPDTPPGGITRYRDRIFDDKRGDPYHARAKYHEPTEIVVTHDHDEDVYVALRDAFVGVTRRLEDYPRPHRGDVMTHQVPAGAKVAQVPVDEE